MFTAIAFPILLDNIQDIPLLSRLTHIIHTAHPKNCPVYIGMD